MYNHEAEEDRVEPGEGTVEASDQTPGNGEIGIAGIMDLACQTIWILRHVQSVCDIKALWFVVGETQVTYTTHRRASHRHFLS